MDRFKADCEIYNWKELNEKYRLNSKDDKQTLFLLLEKKGISVLDELDGIYAFYYKKDNIIYLARDIIGIKPLWYSDSNEFAFGFEKKILEKKGLINIHELNPRKILKIENNKLEFIDREFFKITPLIKDNLNKIVDNTRKLLISAVKKRVSDEKIGVLFSGGLDSTVLALILKKLGYKFICYTCVFEDGNFKQAQDLEFAEKIAKEYKLNHKIIKIKLRDIEKHLKKIIPLIEDYNVVKVGVALPLFLACSEAKKDKCRIIFSGLGSEEIFAGYQRHKNSNNINKECISGLLKMYKRDNYRDIMITKHNNLKLKTPYLDKDLVECSLRIPPEYKICKQQEKFVLRQAAKKIKLKKEYALRPKKAAQYGSNFHKALKRLTKKNKFKFIKDYLRTFYPKKNIRLGALISSGKDSIYAMHIMLRQNYPVKCMISIKSKNPDSFMYHTHNIELVKLQSESIGIPLIEQTTKGKKEDELKDLKKALIKAKKEFEIQGVITGALYSDYQRQRIEKICNELSLKTFSPLWHIDQETEMREILNNNFEVIITSIAADGLDKTWLGKRIDNKAVDDLVIINKKNKINISGEGGEYESLVLNAPIFKKRIHIKKARKIMENKYTGVLKIEKAEL